MADFTVFSSSDSPGDTGQGTNGFGTLRQGFNYLAATNGGKVRFASNLGNSPTFASTASLGMVSGVTYDLEVASSFFVSIANALSGAGSLTKSGAGTVILTGANSYAGTTTVAAGTLRLSGSLGNTNINVGAGATFWVQAAGSSASQSRYMILEGTASNPAVAIFQSTGTFSSDTLQVGVFGNGSVSHSSGRVTTDNRITLGAEVAGNGGYTVSGGEIFTARLTIGERGAGVFQQTGGSVSATTYEMTLGLYASASGRYYLSGGTLSTNAVVIGDTGYGAFYQSGGALNAGGAILTLGRNRLSGSDRSNALYSMSDGALTTARTQVSDGNSDATFTHTGGLHSTNTLSLNGAFSSGTTATYTLGGGAGSSAVLATRNVTRGSADGGSSQGVGVFHFNGGLLQARINTTVFFQGLSVADVQVGGARIDTAGFNVTLLQALVTGVTGGPDGGLTKLGAGALTLSGASTYSGSTMVVAGVLVLNGSVTSALEVGAGATLRGKGQTSQGVAVLAGATFKPGDPLGSFTSAALAVAGSFIAVVGADVAGFGQAVVTGSGSGAVTLSGVLSVDYTGGSPGFNLGSSLRIINNTGAAPISGAFSNAPEGTIIGSSAGYAFRVSYVGGDGNDVTLTEVAGVYGTPAADTLTGTSAADTIYGFDGADTLSGGFGADVVNGGLGADVLYGNQDDDVLFGNQDNDILYGGQGADIAYGGQGDDVLYGNIGDDALYGNLGNDTLNGGVGVNVLDGADGIDTADYSDAASGVIVSLLLAGSAQATGNSSDTLLAIESLTGSAFADTLTGDANANVLSGGFGADTLSGGLGADILYGNQDNDILYGNQDNDVLYGGQGNDTLYGGQGDDVLQGGAGADILYGNLGADRFVYAAAGDSPVTGVDVIADFLSGTDKIDLRLIHTGGASDSFTLAPGPGGITTLDVDLGANGSIDLRVTIIGTAVTGDVIWT